MGKANYKLFLTMIVLLITSTLCSLSLAQSFEGKITTRDIAINSYALESALMNEVEENYDESWDELSDEELLKMQSRKLFEFSIDKLKSLVQSSEGYDYSEESLYSEYKSEIWIKGKKFSVTGTDDEGEYVTIFEMGKPLVYMLKPSEKIVVELDIEKYSERMKEILEKYNSNSESKFSMTSTGKAKKINGFNCTAYEGTNEEGNLQQLWITKEIDGSLFSSFMQILENVDKMTGKETNAKEIAFFKEVEGLSILDKEISTGNLNISEVLSIEKMNVPDSRFIVPSDYQIMSWQQMMGME